MRKARFYETEEGKVHCRLCPNQCVIRDEKTGICRVRKNIGGELFTTNYGQITSYGMDPIEKKPLYHFYPGHEILSVGTTGCNLHCEFCQNWEIAHGSPSTVAVTARQVVEMALSQKDRDCVGIAYTYSEPSVWYEFVYDCAVLAHEAGLTNVLVTNGFIEAEPLDVILPYIDAMNVDVKAFTDDFYRKVCKGGLKAVLRTVEQAVPRCHVELTTLLVTGLNDEPDEITALRDWVASVDPSLPLHLSRYSPRYKMTDRPSTPMDTMRMAREIAMEKLSYVYLGNVWDDEAADTFCPQCHKKVVDRTGFLVRSLALDAGNRCTFCGFQINILGRARVSDPLRG
ncbi:MAG: AmmeMemoRadiSam system radical SAM enzyme [Bacillota bacterium]